MSRSLRKADIASWMDGVVGWGEGANHLLAWAWGDSRVPFPIGPPSQSADPGGGHLPPSLDRHKGEEAESRERVSEGREGKPGSSRSELGGAAGVALQQTHDGRVAFGPADELLQGQLEGPETP